MTARVVGSSAWLGACGLSFCVRYSFIRQWFDFDTVCWFLFFRADGSVINRADGSEYFGLMAFLI